MRPPLPPTWTAYLDALARWRRRPYNWEDELPWL